jgi:hypothetical protein
MRVIKDDFTPELCIVIVFDASAIPVMVFGLTGKIDPFLIAGFSQAVSSFIDYISTYLPDISEEKAIINNFINSGFYYRKFRSKKSNKDFAFIFRPIYNKLFSEDWISKILDEIVRGLEQTNDIEKKAQELFGSFNSRLFQEIKSIDYIREHEKKAGDFYKLLFRKSGVHVGGIDDKHIEKIIDIAVNNFDIKEFTLNLDGKIFEIKKKEILDGLSYYTVNKFKKEA